MLVGFQGEPGAFSEEAIRALLGDVATQGYRTFEDVAAAVQSRRVDCALLPCENTIAGPIPQVHTLLDRYGFAVTAEIAHPIEQCLIGIPGAGIARLARAASHAVALAQCRRFFLAHPHIAPEVAEDTAGAVRAMAARGDLRLAAIGPALAAERYGGIVLERGIQDAAGNVTRFLLVRYRR